MTVPVLEAIGLQKRFGALTVTNNVSLTINRGVRLALIGPNGAGKTTLVGLLTGSLKPNAGTIQFLGSDITREKAETRVKRGLVRTFQINNLFDQMTVRENIFLAVSEHRQTSRAFLSAAAWHRNILEIVDRHIDTLGLADIRDEKVAYLPYGRQRLLEIALALCLEPKLLLLDEPAAGIPEHEIATFLKLLEKLPEELPILLIEHDMHIVRRFAGEVAVLVHGAIIAQGSPADVMASADVQSAYLGRTGQTRFGGA